MQPNSPVTTLQRRDSDSTEPGKEWSQVGDRRRQVKFLIEIEN